ncbi:MAG: acyl-CoA thioesterase, partial [Candidatus Omnitrophota bacterium]
MKYFAYSQQAFIYKYVVMLSDTDQFQHMSFANYLRLMFLATDAMFLSCSDRDFLVGYRFHLLASRMQFKKQSNIGDSILIKVNAAKGGPETFTLLYTFALEGAGDLVALAKQTYGVLDLKENKQVPPMS